MGTNLEGHTFDFDDKLIGATSVRAIVDIGLLDVEQNHINPVDPNLKFVGASSDMLVINLGENKKNYKIGDLIEFTMDYMGALRVINSKYIEKRINR
jgi:predicted amino acid racemase